MSDKYDGAPLGGVWPTPTTQFADDEIIGIIVTEYGANAIAKAALEGRQVNITHVAVGDSNGEAQRPDPLQTKLIHECWRGEIKRYEINEFDPTQLVVVSVIPAEIGTFWIREVGIFDSEGGLIAVGNFPPTQKVKDKTGAIQTLELRTYIQFSNAVLEHVHIIVRRDGIDEAHEEIHRLVRHLKEDVWKVSRKMVEELTSVTWVDPNPPDEDDGCGCLDLLSEVTSAEIHEMFEDDD